MFFNFLLTVKKNPVFIIRLVLFTHLFTPMIYAAKKLKSELQLNLLHALFY